jgi:hypothetical protein
MLAKIRGRNPNVCWSRVTRFLVSASSPLTQVSSIPVLIYFLGYADFPSSFLLWQSMRVLCFAIVIIENGVFWIFSSTALYSTLHHLPPPQSNN